MTTSNPGSGGTGQYATSSGVGGVAPPTGRGAEAAQTTETQGEAGAMVSAVVDQAKDTVSGLVDQATEQTKPRLEGQKERAADGLGSTAHALRKTSRELRDQEEAAPIADYAEKAAARVERMADYLREREIGELIGEVEDFARRQPVLFVGGAFTLGLLAARFLKSSGERGTSQRGTGRPTVRGYLPAPGQTSASRSRPTGAYAPPPIRPMAPQTQMPGRYPAPERGTMRSPGAGTAPFTQHTPASDASRMPPATPPHTAASQVGQHEANRMPGGGAAGSGSGPRPATGTTPGQRSDGGRA